MTRVVILSYFGIVLAIGAASHRLFRGTGEDYFLATRTIGPFVLLMSLFGTHMTAFSLLGASGEAYREGIGVFGLMASSSALVVPLVFLGIGTRLWRLGKSRGYLTQVQYFRERYDSDGLGLALFVVLTGLLIPYLLIGVLGGGIALQQITAGTVPRWAGSLLICVVVMAYVTSGGLRGTAWANTFQTLVFMILGAAAFFVVVHRLGGLARALDAVEKVAPELLVRGDAIPPLKMATYLLIPLSVGMFPHIFMHWLTARRLETFRLTLVAYPFCIAVVWLPSILLGVLGRAQVPGLEGAAANTILVRMIHLEAPEFLAGLLAAGVFAAVMSSLDSQVLSLGTMFTQDVVRHHALHGRMTERQQVLAGRLFVAVLLLVTFLLSCLSRPSLFSLGIWSFTGFAALFPLVAAALFWKRSTRAGAWASLLTVVVAWTAFFLRSWSVPDGTLGGGVLPVAVILPLAAAALIGVSLATAPPRPDRVAIFFPRREAA
ncbi:MAG: sodium:solute symporter [Acidobacteriota bacterium]